MARCFVTVEGQTMEADASSKFGAIFAYDADQRTGAALHRTFPKLEDDTPVTVRATGKVATGTPAQAKAWARRWCDDREKRERAWKPAKKWAGAPV